MTPPPADRRARAPASSTRSRWSPPTRAVILVGNPNVGKSVLFGALTGKYVTVSNYPGTTVEVTRGSATIEGQPWHVMDTPGTNNLLPMSEDEQVTRDILLAERGYVCLQVCDAKNLRRGLLLAAQLAEAEIPFVLALNMADEAASRGLRHRRGAALARRSGSTWSRPWRCSARGSATLQARLDAARARLAVPAALRRADRGGASPRSRRSCRRAASARGRSRSWRSSATSRSGRTLAAHLARGGPRPDRRRPALGRGALPRVAPLRHRAPAARRGGPAARRGRHARRRIRRERLRAQARRLVHAPAVGDPDPRGRLCTPRTSSSASSAPGRSSTSSRTRCSRSTSSRGSPPAVRFLAPDGRFESFLVGPPGADYLQHDGILIGKYGVVSMGLSYGIAIVLPIVTTFFIAFSVLEDSGYLPRLAVMLNKVFKRMGLNGKAVLPMVLGLGCDTMATMTARIMETRKERVIVTLLLALGVPCSAQMAVIFAMTSKLPMAATRLVRRDRPARACSSSAGSPRRCSRGAARTSCWSCRRSASRRPATSR